MLSFEDRSVLARDGAVCLRGAIDGDCVRQIAEAFDLSLREPGPFQQRFDGNFGIGRYTKDLYVSHFNERFFDVSHGSALASIAAGALGFPQVRLAFDSWIMLHPGTVKRTVWHQDHGVDGKCLVLWVPIDPAPKGTGLEVIAGSHRWPTCYYRDEYHPIIEEGVKSGRVDPENSAGRRLAPVSELLTRIKDQEFEVLSWDMSPGDCVVLDCFAVHGGGANTTTHDIRRYSSRWMEPNAKLSPHGAEFLKALIRNNDYVPERFVDDTNYDYKFYPLLPAEPQDGAHAH